MTSQTDAHGTDEPDCEAVTRQALAEGGSSRVYTKLVVDPEVERFDFDLGPWAAIFDVEDGQVEDFVTTNAGTFFEAGGRYEGTEGPVRRAIAIGQKNGLIVTSTGRESGNSDSDHYSELTSAAAVDMSNYPSPTPEMERTATHIAAAMGISGWTKGEPLIRLAQGMRFQLLWGTSGHNNHVHFGCRKVG